MRPKLWKWRLIESRALARNAGTKCRRVLKIFQWFQCVTERFGGIQTRKTLISETIVRNFCPIGMVKVAAEILPLSDVLVKSLFSMLFFTVLGERKERSLRQKRG
jgi:hypothetical protein